MRCGQKFFLIKKIHCLKKEPPKTLGFTSPTWKPKSHLKTSLWVSNSKQSKEDLFIYAHHLFQLLFHSLCVNQNGKLLLCHYYNTNRNICLLERQSWSTNGSGSLKNFFNILKFGRHILWRLPSKTKDMAFDHYSISTVTFWLRLSFAHIKSRHQKLTLGLPWWLRLHIPNAGALDSIPDQGTRSRMPQWRVCMSQLKRSLKPQLKNPQAATKTEDLMCHN